MSSSCLRKYRQHLRSGFCWPGGRSDTASWAGQGIQPFWPLALPQHSAYLQQARSILPFPSLNQIQRLLNYRQKQLKVGKRWDLSAQRANKSLLKGFASPDCVNFYSSRWSGAEILRFCLLWDKGWGVLANKLWSVSGSLCVCGGFFPAEAELSCSSEACLAACVSSSINLVLPWLQELLTHEWRTSTLPSITCLSRRSRTCTGLVEEAVAKHSSIPMLAKSNFQFWFL